MQTEPELFGAPIMAQLKAGDAFVWDDRMIHGSCCGKERPPPGAIEPLFRAAVHVTMSPKALVRHFPQINGRKPVGPTKCF